MKILITGSNGLLGQKIIDALAGQSNIQLTATSKGDNRYPDNKGFIYKDLDITSPDQVKALFREVMPDVVINTAAMTNVDACELDHASCDAINVSAVKYMTETLTTLKNESGSYDPLFIHLSTDFIFDGLDGPYAEDAKPAPLSYYGNSKLISEQIVSSSSVRNAIVRTILVYGVAHNLSRSNIVLWIKESLEKQKDINIVDDQFRTPTLAEDLAQACISIALKDKTGLFHISGKDFMSIYELAQREADYYGLDKKYIHVAKSEGIKQPAARPPRTGFVLDKAIREINYKPHSFEEGLQLVKDQLLKL